MNNIIESNGAADTSATGLDDAVVAQLRAAVLQTTALDDAVVAQLRAAVLQATALDDSAVAQLRAAVLRREAVEKKRHEEMVKFAEDAAARAAEIIANIPRLLLEAKEDIGEVDEVEVMVLDRREWADGPGDPVYVCYAARTVFDYCERAGLRPKMVRRSRSEKGVCNDYAAIQIPAGPDKLLVEPSACADYQPQGVFG